MAILDAKRFELALERRRGPRPGSDGFTSIIAPEDGKYIIQVRESAYAGNGVVPLPAARRATSPGRRPCMPAGGKPGETLAVRWIGDAAGETPRPGHAAGLGFRREFGI